MVILKSLEIGRLVRCYCMIDCLPAAKLTAKLIFCLLYVFRGTPNFSRHPPLHGCVVYVQGNGWYMGNRASSVDFNDGSESRSKDKCYFGHAGSAGMLFWNAAGLAHVYPVVRRFALGRSDQ